MNTLSEQAPVATEPRSLTPEARLRDVADGGMPVALGDGNAWRLAAHIPAFGPVWDQLHALGTDPASWPVSSVRVAAVHLLRANYDLTQQEAMDLIGEAGPWALLSAVQAAMNAVSHARPRWSDWVRASLRINGVDPDAVSPAERDAAITLLLRAGRTVPMEELRAEWGGPLFGEPTEARVAERFRLGLFVEAMQAETPPLPEPSAGQSGQSPELAPVEAN